MNNLNGKKRVSITVPLDDYDHIHDLAERFGSSMDRVGSKLALLGLKLLKEDPEQQLDLCPCRCEGCSNIIKVGENKCQ